MAAAAGLELRTVGVSHRSATAELREQLLLDEAAYGDLLQALKAAGFRQALVLSTCDRTELTVAGGDCESAVDQIWQRLASIGHLPAESVKAQGYDLQGEAALRHLFAVASALDSVVIGEPFVLGQLKTAHREAQAAGTAGPALETAIQAAFHTAKRVRSETSLGERPVSLAAAVLQLARRVHGQLDKVGATLLGGGEMGELIIEQLRQGGLSRIAVLHKSDARGRLIAHRLGGHMRPWGEMAPALAAADVLIAAIGDDRQAVSAPMLQAALKARRQRPILCIDCAIPGDVDKGADKLDGVFLFDLADLEKMALEGQQSRQAASAPAWKIVDDEVAAFTHGLAAAGGDASIVALRRHFDEIRRQVLAETGGDAEAATRLLVNKLLHTPSAALRSLAAEGNREGAAKEFLCRLFGLAPPGSDRKEDES
ncbi:MAG TPA: glutamyl-tRNA reductase [Dongiaceae bacterium]